MKSHSYTVRTSIAGMHDILSEPVGEPISIPDDMFRSGQHDRFMAYLKGMNEFCYADELRVKDLLGTAVGLFFEPPMKAIIWYGVGGTGGMELHFDRVESV